MHHGLGRKKGEGCSGVVYTQIANRKRSSQIQAQVKEELKAEVQKKT